MAGCIKQIGVLESGDLNPEQSRDTERKIDPTEEDPLVALGRLMYEKDESGNKRASWNGVVMRVDKFEDGIATCKVRVPEKDIIPEPQNFIPSNVKDPSHSIIDMHRDYVGKTPVAPVIGQVVKVGIPANNSLTKVGELLEVTDQKYFLPAKHTEKEEGDSGAKGAVGNGGAAPPSVNLVAPSGDEIGSLQKDASTQVPPINTEDISQ